MIISKRYRKHQYCILIFTEISNLEFNETHRQSPFSLAAHHAYIGLEIICGKSVYFMTKVLFDLLPSIQMTPAKDGTLYLPKALLVIREHSLYFIYHILEMVSFYPSTHFTYS